MKWRRHSSPKDATPVGAIHLRRMQPAAAAPFISFQPPPAHQHLHELAGRARQRPRSGLSGPRSDPCVQPELPSRQAIHRRRTPRDRLSAHPLPQHDAHHSSSARDPQDSIEAPVRLLQACRRPPHDQPSRLPPHPPRRQHRTPTRTLGRRPDSASPTANAPHARPPPAEGTSPRHLRQRSPPPPRLRPAAAAAGGGQERRPGGAVARVRPRVAWGATREPLVFLLWLASPRVAYLIISELVMM
jgi:hypothetical protein